MIRKNISIIIIAAIMLGLIIPAFAASITSLDASIDASKVVTITGNISTGEGKQVTVRVTDPEGNLDYANQAESGTDGLFTFTYTLTNTVEGTYTVAVSGEDVETAAATTFVYTEAAEEQVAAPTASPSAGTYSTAQSVTLSCATEGASIYYTTDGATPTTSSTLYSGAITVSKTTTIKAIAVKSGMTDSYVASFTYVIDENAVVINSLSAAIDSDKLVTISGYISSGEGKQVTVKVTDPEGNIDYANQAESGTDGIFTFTYTLTNTVEGTYIVTVNGEDVTTPATTTFTYTEASSEKVATPTASPAAGTYKKKQTVTLSCETEGASIYYTTDGSTPTTASTLYSEAIIVKKTSTIKAIAVKEGMTNSDVAVFKYTISSGSSGGSSGGSGGSSSVNANVTTVNKGTIKAVTTTTTSNGKIKATAVITKDNFEKALKLAPVDSIGMKIIDIIVEETKGASTYNVSLPKIALTSETANMKVIIKTSLGTIEAPNNMFTSEEIGDAENIELSIAARDVSEVSGLTKEQIEAIGTKPIIDLNAYADGKKITFNNPDVPVKVSIPYTPTAEELADPEKLESITIWYIDDNGNVSSIPNGRYNTETGMVEFTTTHFSIFAAVLNEKTFKDLSGYDWAETQINVLAAKGIINGTSKDTFAPGKNITRADFMLLLVRAFDLKADVVSGFADVNESDYYYDALMTAKALGIATGIGDNKFNPRGEISRQDMMVLVARTLDVLGKSHTSGTINDINGFDDASDVAGYAVNDVAGFVKDGIIKGSYNKISPKGTATRAEVAVMLYRLLIENNLFN